MPKFRFALLGGTMLAGLFGANTVSAQSAQAAAAAEEEPEIIVTARLRGDEALQDVPLALTVVSPQQLQSQGALTIEDVETLAPNLVIDPVAAGPGGGAISIRGVSF